MVAEVISGMVQGIEGELIKIQADISEGLPIFYMIGYLANEVKEAKERVRTALKNTGFHLPPKRISVNLAPADQRKSGTNFDLAIAIALFLAMELVTKERITDTLFLGELSLDGTITPIQGVLPIVKQARTKGIHRCIVPKENALEASMIEGMDIYCFRKLKEVFEFLTQGRDGDLYFPHDEKRARSLTPLTDISQVKGQENAKRALEIAVAGYHNLFMDGPPGSGKSMLSSCVPGIMPEMSVEEKLETTMIYSVKGLLKEDMHLVADRPFRAPSHAVTKVGMYGGGGNPQPGEVSLANHGCLFLDEFPEYPRDFIEMLRVPLEEHYINIVRKEKTVVYPADFIFIAAANPCPCGYYPDRSRCRCTKNQIKKYHGKISGPIADRIDLFVRCDPVSFDTLMSTKKTKTSSQVREEIRKVWSIQKDRFSKENIHFNGRMSSRQTEEYCRLSIKDKQLMRKAFSIFHLTGRGYYRVLKIARTIADLDGKEEIRTNHIEEALSYRANI